MRCCARHGRLQQWQSWDLLKASDESTVAAVRHPWPRRADRAGSADSVDMSFEPTDAARRWLARLRGPSTGVFHNVFLVWRARRAGGARRRARRVRDHRTVPRAGRLPARRPRRARPLRARSHRLRQDPRLRHPDARPHQPRRGPPPHGHRPRPHPRSWRSRSAPSSSSSARPAGATSSPCTAGCPTAPSWRRCAGVRR